MKTAKFILHVLAIMTAVAGALATENAAPAVILVPVSAQNVGTACIKDGTCDTDDASKNTNWHVEFSLRNALL